MISKKKTFRLDIFKILDRINNDDKQYFDTLTDDDYKALSPIVVQNWLMGADTNKDTRYVLMDEYTNKYIFSLGHHKKLLMKMFCVSNGFDDGSNFSYVKPSITQKNEPLIKLFMRYYKTSYEDALKDYKVLKYGDYKMMCDDLGMDNKETKAILGLV